MSSSHMEEREREPAPRLEAQRNPIAELHIATRSRSGAPGHTRRTGASGAVSQRSTKVGNGSAVLEMPELPAVPVRVGDRLGRSAHAPVVLLADLHRPVVLDHCFVLPALVPPMEALLDREPADVQQVFDRRVQPVELVRPTTCSCTISRSGRTRCGGSSDSIPPSRSTPRDTRLPPRSTHQNIHPYARCPRTAAAASSREGYRV